MLPTVHAPTLRSSVSTLALVTFVLQEHSVLKDLMCLRTVQQEHTMMSMVRKNANPVQLVTTVYKRQSRLSITRVQVVITVQSIPLSLISTNAHRAALTIWLGRRQRHLVCHVQKVATVKVLGIPGQQVCVAQGGIVMEVQHLIWRPHMAANVNQVTTVPKGLSIQGNVMEGNSVMLQASVNQKATVVQASFAN